VEGEVGVLSVVTKVIQGSDYGSIVQVCEKSPE
jgi:hypothetical protein